MFIPLLLAIVISLYSLDITYKTSVKLKKLTNCQRSLEALYKDCMSTYSDLTLQELNEKLENRIKITRKLEKRVNKLEKKVNKDFTVNEL